MKPCPYCGNRFMHLSGPGITLNRHSLNIREWWQAICSCGYRAYLFTDGETQEISPGKSPEKPAQPKHETIWGALKS